jgi:nucleoside-diphosphate-sugar epimerase
VQDLPDIIQDERQLEELLSRPSPAVVETFARMKGDLVVLGGSGKIGPSLVGMACRARRQAGSGQRIFAVARFGDPSARAALQQAGAQTISADLLDPQAVRDLPQAPNVIYMVGQKFGTTHRPDLTWAVNAVVPAYAAEHYRRSRIVAYSTGCVYDLWPTQSRGPDESAPLAGPGEYAASCVARERVLEFFSRRHATPMTLVRLNYALDLRYGVVADLARQIAAGEPVDLAMGYFNAIWQGDANAMVLRLLEHAACPPLAINLTGTEKLSVRQIAARLGELMGKPVSFVGQEAPTALLSNAAKACRLLGPAEVPIDRVIAWTAHWIAAGRRSLDKPTHFQQREGKY